jgi:RND family efflux transporter MFP subunit
MFGVLAPMTAGANDAVAVKVVKPSRVLLERQTTQPGSVSGLHEAEIYSRVSGYVKRVLVDIGDEVKAGQVLVEIDVPELGRVVARQQAEVDRLVSEQARYEAGVEVAEAHIVQALADAQKVEAQVKADQMEHDRVAKLVKTKSVTDRLLDEAVSRLDASKAALVSVKANETVARANLKAAKAEIGAAAAAVEVAKMSRLETETLMSFTKLKAPFAGVVTQRGVDPGDLVREDKQDTPALTVVDSSKVRVRVAVPERDATWVDAGDAVEFACDGLPHKKITGKVTRFSNRLDPKTRSMMVEIEIANPEGALMPGMFGRVTLTLEHKPDCLVVPAGSVRYGGEGQPDIVYVVDSNNKVTHVTVKTGMDDGLQIQIVEGLNGSERVVTGMLGRLFPDQVVRVISEN